MTGRPSCGPCRECRVERRGLRARRRHPVRAPRAPRLRRQRPPRLPARQPRSGRPHVGDRPAPLADLRGHRRPDEPVPPGRTLAVARRGRTPRPTSRLRAPDQGPRIPSPGREVVPRHRTQNRRHSSRQTGPCRPRKGPADPEKGSGITPDSSREDGPLPVLPPGTTPPTTTRADPEAADEDVVDLIAGMLTDEPGSALIRANRRTTRGLIEQAQGTGAPLHELARLLEGQLPPHPGPGALVEGLRAVVRDLGFPRLGAPPIGPWGDDATPPLTEERAPCDQCADSPAGRGFVGDPDRPSPCPGCKPDARQRAAS